MPEAIDDLRRLLSSQRFGVLSTRRADGQPYASLVALVASEDLRELSFATLRATRKFANLQAEPRVAVLLDSRDNRAEDLREAMAATALGEVRELEGSKREQVALRLQQVHPGLEELLSSRGCAVLTVQVQRYVTVTRFQDVVDIDLVPVP